MKGFIGKRLILGLNHHGLLNWMSDKANIKLVYRAQTGKKLDLNAPQTFNEKLQWLKLYDRNPAYCKMADKLLARDYIAETIGAQYLIPFYGAWDDETKIDFDALPEQFVLKCTHDSGSVIICKDKAALDREKTLQFFHKRLRTNGYAYGREWPYKSLTPHIIAEKYLVDAATDDLRDYKIHCFNGEPKLVLVCSERHKAGLREDWFTVDWKHLPIHRPTHFNSEKPVEQPKNLAKMLELAQKLSAGIPFLRVDFYEVNEAILFGELTFFPTSGYTAFVPEEYDAILGSWLTLPAEG